MSIVVLTVIGDDRPGLVQSLAEVIETQQGNWERSQLAQLAGQFAGLVEVDVADDSADALVAALRDLPGLSVEVRAGARTSAPRGGAVLELVGNDHPGIVAQITAALAAQGANIERLETATEDAPMSGGRLFRARAEVSLSPGADPLALEASLEQLADELMVDLTVAATDPAAGDAGVAG